MAKPSGVWGIDIGQCALKALRLEMIDGQPTATAFDYIEHPKILSQPDADPDALTREALDKFLSRNPLNKDVVAISVPGQSGLARFVKLPPVEEKKIPDIVKFEAKQQIPFPLEEVVWDYQRLSEKQEMVGGFAMETEIGLFAMKRDIVNRYLGHYQGVKAEVHLVQMAPLALANYAAYEVLRKRGGDAAADDLSDLPPGKKRKCAVLLDIGTEGSNLIITDGAKVIWQRPVPLGGNNFTRVLTKEMKLTFAKAEHLKRNAAKSPDLAQILKALRPVLTDFVGEVQRSLGYFTNTHRDAHVAFMVGLGSAFKLPGLQKYLSEKLSLDVRKPAKFEGVGGEAVLNDAVFGENLLTFPVAYGLALQGLATLQPTADEQKKYALLRTNLLPTEIRVDRLIRAKKPWAAAAAAVLLTAVAFAGCGKGIEYRAIHDDKITAAMGKGKTSTDAAKGQNGQYSAKEAEVKDETSKVKAIVAGNEERLNWVRIHEVLAAAVPTPPAQPFNPENPDYGNFYIPDAPPAEHDARKVKVERYVNSVEFDRDIGLSINAPEAIAKYYARVRAGVPPEKIYDATRSADLPVINIEAVDCRYTDNLQQFLDNANTYANKNHAQNIVEDLKDERTVRVKKWKEDGTVEEVDEKLPAEREASTTPNVKGTKPEHNFNPKAPEGAGWVVEVRGYTFHRDSWVFVRDSLIYNLQNFHRFAQKTDPVKVGKVLHNVNDPVLGRVSHVFLAAEKITKADTITPKNPLKLDLLNKSLLNTLVPSVGAAGGDAGGGGTGGIPGGGGMIGAGAGGGSPDGGGEGGKAGMYGAGMGGPGGGPGGAAGGGWKGLLRGTVSGGGDFGNMLGEGGGGIPGFGGPTGGTNTAGSRPKSQQLTEFIVYFIWREPTPTDALTAGQ